MEQAGSRKFAWVRELRPLIAGDPMTPFVRVALAGDVTSALTHWGTGGLRYINADFTMTLGRLPDGDYIGLASDGHNGGRGVASGSATLFDRHGPIGPQHRHRAGPTRRGVPARPAAGSEIAARSGRTAPPAVT